jgi:hypothetical protein
LAELKKGMMGRGQEHPGIIGGGSVGSKDEISLSSGSEFLRPTRRIWLHAPEVGHGRGVRMGEVQLALLVVGHQVNEVIVIDVS